MDSLSGRKKPSAPMDTKSLITIIGIVVSILIFIYIIRDLNSVKAANEEMRNAVNANTQNTISLTKGVSESISEISKQISMLKSRIESDERNASERRSASSSQKNMPPVFRELETLSSEDPPPRRMVHPKKVTTQKESTKDELDDLIG